LRKCILPLVAIVAMVLVGAWAITMPRIGVAPATAAIFAVDQTSGPPSPQTSGIMWAMADSSFYSATDARGNQAEPMVVMRAGACSWGVTPLNDGPSTTTRSPATSSTTIASGAQDKTATSYIA